MSTYQRSLVVLAVVTFMVCQVFAVTSVAAPARDNSGIVGTSSRAAAPEEPSVSARSRIVALPMAPDRPINAEDYVLGPGDELDIQIRCARPEEYRRQISIDGTLLLPPPLGAVAASGKSLAQFRQDLYGLVDRFYKQFELDVVVIQPRTFRVGLYGHVRNPGMYLANALTRVSDLIEFGRILDSGSHVYGTLERDRQQFQIDLAAILEEGDTTRDLVLEPGDKVIVPPRGPQVTLAGAFRNPGTYELRPAEGLRALLERKGGPAGGAALTEAYVQRVSDDGQYTRIACNLAELLQGSDALTPRLAMLPQHEPPHLGAGTSITALPRERFEAREMPDIILKDGDYVWLPAAAELAGRVTIAGEIKLLRDLPADPTAQIDQERLPNVKVKAVPRHSDLVLSRSTGASEGARTSEQPSDYEWVVEVPYEEGMHLGDLLRALGGPTDEASLHYATFARLTDHESRKYVSVDFAALWHDQDESQDIELQPGDFIRLPSVREHSRRVLLSGEIIGFDRHEQRTFQLVDGLTAGKLVMRAGGPTTFAALSQATIERPTPDGGVKAIKVDLEKVLAGGDTQADVVLQDRDSLRIPNVEEYLPTIRIVGEFLAQDFQFPGHTQSMVTEVTDKLAGDKYLLYKFRRGEHVSDVLRALGGPDAKVNWSAAYLERAGTEGRNEFVQLDLHAIWDLRNPAADPELSPGDTLVLPSIKQHVYVVGAVRNPGPYAFRHMLTLADYVNRAGGYLREARQSEVKIIRKEGDKTELIHVDATRKQRDPKNDPQLQAGDIVVVPTSTVSGMKDVLDLLGRLTPGFLIWDRVFR